MYSLVIPNREEGNGWLLISANCLGWVMWLSNQAAVHQAFGRGRKSIGRCTFQMCVTLREGALQREDTHLYFGPGLWDSSDESQSRVAGFQTDGVTTTVCSSVEDTDTMVFHITLPNPLHCQCGSFIMFLKIESAPPPIGSDISSYRLRQLSSAVTCSLQAGSTFPCWAPFHFFISLHHYMPLIIHWYIKE